MVFNQYLHFSPVIVFFVPSLSYDECYQLEQIGPRELLPPIVFAFLNLFRFSELPTTFPYVP